MRFTFYFDFPEAAAVSLIGDFNGWSAGRNMMRQNEHGAWETEVELPPGEYKYKYLIDDVIRMNDPHANLYAPDEKKELKSVLIINEKGERMVNTEQYQVHLENYFLSAKVSDETPKENKKFFMQTDEKVVCRFEFTDVTGIHAVTVLWYRPDGGFYYQTEDILWTPEEIKDKPIVMQHWLNIAESHLTAGKWKLRLYIDGIPVLEDYFIIKTVSYALNKGYIALK